MRIGWIWALFLLMNTFSQSSKQKIPDCLDKSSSCLTDRWWDRFLDTRILRTTENECGKNLVSHKSYNQMKLLCTICANENLSSKKAKTKPSHLLSAEQALFVESFTDCWLCFMVTSLQTLIDGFQIRITTQFLISMLWNQQTRQWGWKLKAYFFFCKIV